MRKAVIKKEILFVTHSSKDDKGKRCIVRIDNTENIVYPEELGDPILQVMGLDSVDIKEIAEFFERKINATTKED